MSAPIDNLRAAFPHAIWAGDKGKDRCPVHDDRHASLSLGIGKDGKGLVFCHACGKERTPEILAAVGLAPTDLFPANGNGNGHHKPPPAPRIVATYDYDPGGALRYQTVRLEPKGFYQRRPNGKGGWINNLDGVERVLYRSDALRAADPDEWVFIPEGERDTDNVIGLGLVATTSAGGTNGWRASFAAELRGRKLAILCDNDAVGRGLGAEKVRSLYGLARSLKFIDFRELPEKGDVSDWLALGHGREDLIYRAEAAPEWAPAVDPCAVELAAAQERIAELEAKLAEVEAARAEEATAHAAHLRAIQAVVTHKAWKDGDKVFALRLGPRLIAAQERTDEDGPVRLPVASISREIGHGRHADSKRVERFAATGILEASVEGELRVWVDRATGEVAEKPGQATYQRTEARSVAEFYSRVAAAQPERSNHGGWRWDGKTCRNCGEAAVETHTHGTCTNCGQRYKDGVPVGGVRTPPNPLLDQVDPIRESGPAGGYPLPPVTFLPSSDQVDPPAAEAPIPPAPTNGANGKPYTNGNGHKPTPTDAEIAAHRAILGGKTWADMSAAERAASFRGSSPPT